MSLSLEATPMHATPDDLAVRRRAPVFYWALLGGVFVAINIYVYVSWAVSGRTETTPTGADPVPTSAKIAVWIFQVCSCLLAASAVIFVIRKSRREKRLTFDAALLIAWGLCNWQDPIINWVRPAFFYNSYFFNIGGWGSQIPGWSSPRGGWLPEDIIGTAGVGYIWMVGVSVAACALMRAARRRWPSIGPLGLFAVAFCVCGVFDFVVELYMVHLHVWAYPGAIHKLSFFGGTINQFPIYETLAWGSVWCAISLVRFYQDDRGNSVVERGLDDMALSPRGRGVVRTLAVTAILNVFFLIYSVVMVWTTLMPDTSIPAGYPSYLRDGLCGASTPYVCVTSETPIPVRGQPIASNR